MSVSIAEVLESAGYNVEEIDDAIWLMGQRSQWEELVEQADETIMLAEEDESELSDEALDEILRA